MKFVLTSLLLLLGAGCLHGETLDRMEEIASQAKTLDQFLRTPKLTREYGEALRAYFGKKRFNCETYDAILAELRRLDEKVPDLGERLWRKSGDSERDSLMVRVVTEVETDPPDAQEILHRVPRPFHGIWNDSAGEACQAHTCRAAEGLAPERWAIALAGSQLYYLERRGGYSGSAILVLSLRNGSQRLHRVVLTGAPLLRDLHDYQVGTEPVVTSSLLNLWLKWAQPRFDEPLALLQQKDTEPPTYELVEGLAGKESPRHWDTAWDFLPVDGLARELARWSPRHCFADLDEDGRDLVIGNQGKPGAATRVFNLAADKTKEPAPGAVRRLLLSFDYPNQLGQVGKLARTDPKTLDLLLTAGLKDPDEGMRLRALLAIHSLRSVDVPGFRVSNGSSWPGVPLISNPEWNSHLEGALNDSSPTVRGLAALALADRGSDDDDRADLTHAMSQALSPENQSRLWGRPSSDSASFFHVSETPSGRRLAERPGTEAGERRAPSPPVTRTYQGGSVGHDAGTDVGQPAGGGGGGGLSGGGATTSPRGGTGTVNPGGAGATGSPSGPARPAGGATSSGGGAGAGATTAGGISPNPPPSPSRSPFDVIDSLARGVLQRGGEVPEDQLSQIVDQVARMPDPHARSAAEDKLAKVMMANPDFRASTKALVVGLERHPDTLQRLRSAVEQNDCKSANDAFRGAGENAKPTEDH